MPLPIPPSRLGSFLPKNNYRLELKVQTDNKSLKKKIFSDSIKPGSVDNYEDFKKK
ncbi:MAG: hypothetical protein REV35_02370 [Burkholderia sp.]|nr:hypothetical protein [Burkholderia sp.]